MSAEDIIPIATAMQRKKEELEAKGLDWRDHNWSEFDDQIRAAIDKANEKFREESIDLKKAQRLTIIFGNDHPPISTLEERIETMEKLRIRSGMTRKEFGRFFNFISRERDLPEEKRTALANAFYTWAAFIDHYDRMREPKQTKLFGDEGGLIWSR